MGMDIKKISNCKISINNKYYETPEFIRQWILNDNNNVVVACYKTILFIDSDGNVVYAPNTVHDYSQYFSGKNDKL
jgi:hypothetical protein